MAEMADEIGGCEPDKAKDSNKSMRAIELLREVTMVLSDDKTPQEKPQGQRPPSQKETRPIAQRPVGQVGASNVLTNFRNIFAPYNRPSRMPLTSTFQPRRKALKPRQGGLFFQPKETWTHEFFCLALKNQERVPSRAEKMELQDCGLGRKKIVFHSNAQFPAFRKKIEEEFSKLESGGGFVIMRTGHKGSNTLLAKIPSPANGYSVPFSRDCSGLGQAVAYIRPLQRDLNKKPYLR